MVGIYKITSPSGKIYIGQSWDIQARFWRYNCKRGTPKQPSLNASFKKYGFKNHNIEVICTLPNDISQSTLDNYEIYCISIYKEAGFRLMNIRGGGSRGKHSEASKDKIRKTLTGIKHSEERKAKAIKSLMEFKNTERCFEACAKGGKTHKGKVTGEKTKFLLKLAQPSRTPVSVYNKMGELVGVYLSQGDAAKRMGLWQANISASIRTGKAHRRFIFKTKPVQNPPTK